MADALEGRQPFRDKTPDTKRQQEVMADIEAYGERPCLFVFTTGRHIHAVYGPGREIVRYLRGRHDETFNPLGVHKLRESFQGMPRKMQLDAEVEVGNMLRVHHQPGTVHQSLLTYPVPRPGYGPDER